jgi:serine/threonine-protein kinase
MSASTPATAADSRPEPDLSGRRLGDYQVLRRLGRGGMAEVYLAEQQSLRRQVAMKVLRSSLANDEAYVRRFHHEAQAAAKLVHANIVTIHEVGCVDGWHYIAQEYVPGQNLKQLLTRLGRGLDAPQAANIIRQVAAALHKAAEQTITHRDIKPENIMIAGSGEVKVADFGLARVAQAGEALNLTQVGITMGTPLYMSPEQVEGKEVDPRSDIYSLGVTCYHMLAGRTPFDGETALAVAVQHLKQEPQRLEELLPDMPPGLCRIVHRMLAKNPKERYQRAIDILKDLKTVQIPGLDADWTTDLPGWSETEAALNLQGRLEATQQLSRVLRSRRGQDAGGWWGSTALVLLSLIGGGLAAGVAAAWVKQRPLLDAPDDQSPTVRRFDNVHQQYLYAQLAGPESQEAAYRAVAEYFPPDQGAENRRYAWLAQKGLAVLYLQDDRLEDAGRLYEELAALEEEPVLQLSGIAGCAVVYDRLADEGEDKTRLAVFLVALYDKTDEELQQIGSTLYAAVSEVLDKYRQQD